MKSFIFKMISFVASMHCLTLAYTTNVKLDFQEKDSDYNNKARKKQAIKTLVSMESKKNVDTHAINNNNSADSYKLQTNEAIKTFVSMESEKNIDTHTINNNNSANSYKLQTNKIDLTQIPDEDKKKFITFDIAKK